MNTFPLFKQKQIISSILTLIMILITSAIIPTITTIINKTTNIEHPPYNTGGGAKVGGMAYPWGWGRVGVGAWLFSKQMSSQMKVLHPVGPIQVRIPPTIQIVPQ